MTVVKCYSGENYENSNITDLFNWMFTNKKKTVNAQSEFLSILKELNVPQHFLRNKYFEKTNVKSENVNSDHAISNIKKKKRQVVKWSSYK